MERRNNNLLSLFLVGTLIIFTPLTVWTQESSILCLEASTELKAKLIKLENEAPADIKNGIDILRSSDSGQKIYAAVRLSKKGERAKGAKLAQSETLSDLTPLQWVQGGVYGRKTSPAVEAAKALENIGKLAVEPLICALKYEDRDVRLVAAEALGNIKEPCVVEALIYALKNAEPDVRSSAAKSLGEIKDTTAVNALIFSLEDQEVWVRVAASRSLAKMKDLCAVEPLIFHLMDEQFDDRSYAAEALGEIKDTRAVEHLIYYLKNEGMKFRSKAADALGKIKDSRAIEALINALTNEDGFVRMSAAEALKDITSKDFGVDYQKWRNWLESQN